MKNKDIIISGCIGCNTCVNLAPDCFYVKDDGLIGVDEKANKEKILEIAMECPVSAIIQLSHQ